MTVIDMHFHTTFSDWVKTNAEVIDEIKLELNKWEKTFIVSTEHDIFNEELTKLLTENWFDSTYWIEISAHDNIWEKSLHLTFYTDKISKEIIYILNNTRDAKIKKIKLQIELLEKNWFKINYSDFIKYYTNKWANINNLNSFHIKKYIYLEEENKKKILDIVNSDNKSSKNLVIDDINFIKDFLKTNWKFKNYWYVKIERYEPNIEELWKIITKKEWLFLAHPNFTFKDNFLWFYEFIENYKDIITWIEINSKASKNWVEKIIEVSEENNFIITFWSDSHWEWEDEFHWKLWSMNPHVSEELVEVNHKKFLKKLAR